jgi:hypothetical protein
MKTHPLFWLFPVFALMMISGLPPYIVSAQSSLSGVASEISGRVVSQEGQGIPFARVTVELMGRTAQSPPPRETYTDAEGDFRVADLPPGEYYANASLFGYLPSTAVDRVPPKKLRPGESVTLRLVKAGVVSGKVLDERGNPIVSIMIGAIQVRDQDDRKFDRERISQVASTDDRGIYRLFGLIPGSYIVCTAPAYQRSIINPYKGDVPIYHPSSGREEAAEIKVTLGEEVENTDIRWRAQRGNLISGAIILPAKADIGRGVNVIVMNAIGGSQAGGVLIQPDEDKLKWMLDGIPDGEYSVMARSGDGNSEFGLVSAVRKITVKGADVSNVDLTMTPLAVVAGKVVIEKLKSQVEGCVVEKDFSIEGVSIAARQMGASGIDRQLMMFDPWSRVDASGGFIFRGMVAGQYAFMPMALSENLYVRSMTVPVRTAATTRAQPSADISRSGLTVRAGERFTDIAVTLAEGAASLRGTVVASEVASLPPRLKVYLLPAEQAAIDNLLRYAESFATDKGAFTLRSVAPGKYLIIALPLEPDLSVEQMTRFVWHEAAERVRLRRLAESAGTTIELQPCQRATDYKLLLK